MVGLGLKWVAAVGCVAALSAGCVTLHGPTSYTIITFDIERGVETELGSVLSLFQGVELRRPEVDTMPASNRLQLTWKIDLPGALTQGPFGPPLTIGVVVTGAPGFDAQRSRIRLHDVRLEDVRFSGLPRLFSFGLSELSASKGTRLPDIDLMPINPEALSRGGVAYQPTGIEVTYTGLRIDIAPR